MSASRKEQHTATFDCVVPHVTQEARGRYRRVPSATPTPRGRLKASNQTERELNSRSRCKRNVFVLLFLSTGEFFSSEEGISIPFFVLFCDTFNLSNRIPVDEMSKGPSGRLSVYQGERRTPGLTARPKQKFARLRCWGFIWNVAKTTKDKRSQRNTFEKTSKYICSSMRLANVCR